MRIGIIGTGNMGRALGIAWARAGHSVLFGSRDPAKAQAAATVAGNARAGSFDAAAEFGEVVLHTIRNVFPSQLLHRPGALDGKIVIDCNNSDIPGFNSISDEHLDFNFAAPDPSIAERIAADVPKAHVVKAFNSIPAPVIELPREWLARQKISVFVCADDAAAKATVSRLIDEIGFEPVDSGILERARLVETTADFLRFQIIGQKRGMYATLSLHVLSPP